MLRADDQLDLEKVKRCLAIAEPYVNKERMPQPW